MKIEDRRLFTYPVLAEGRDDYKTCTFSAEMKISSDVADNLILEINCRTDCAEIKKLLEDGDAEYLLHVECPATIYREIMTRSLENFSCNIPLNHIKEKLYCVAFIVLRKDIKNFSCRDWNEDFTWLSFNLQKGSVLAYQNFSSVSLPDDPNIFKNVASIFSIYRRAVDDGSCEINLEQDKIKIGLNAKDYNLYRKYCSNPNMQPILNAMIIFPTLVYVFDELKAYNDVEEVFGGKVWFQSLAASYRRKKINFIEHISNEENISLNLAQEVMDLPITKALKNISLIFDTED